MWRLFRAISRRQFASIPAEELQQNIFDTLKKYDTCDPAKLHKDASFKDVGLDSLDTVEVIVALEDLLGIELTDEEALKITTIPEAVEMFTKSRNA